jgi:SAM-dependent methyltransferase
LAALARENAAHLPGVRVRTVVADAREWVHGALPRESEAYDLIVIGFALNEMLPAADKLEPRLEFMRSLRRALSERGLVLILEPALRETAEALQELSDTLGGQEGKALSSHGAIRGRLGEASLPRWGPYLSDHRCPLRTEGKFWNHEVRRWNAPASIALLNRQLWREIDALKFSYALHGRSAPPVLSENFTNAGQEADSLTARLVSPLRLQKGGFIAACVADDGVKYTLDIPIRGLPKEEIERLEKIERGDILALRGLKPLGAPRTLRLPTPAAIAARYHVQ